LVGTEDGVAVRAEAVHWTVRLATVSQSCRQAWGVRVVYRRGQG
jgi:hypothetical protein